MIKSTMQSIPLSINHFLDRAGKIYPESEIVSRMPDKSLRRHRYAEFYARSRRLAAALLAAGLRKGDRVATLSWNHYAHLECYFGIPAAGGVMHTLNLRLAPEEIGWIANHARDRFLIVDDVLLQLLDRVRVSVEVELRRILDREQTFTRRRGYGVGGRPMAPLRATRVHAAGKGVPDQDDGGVFGWMKVDDPSGCLHEVVGPSQGMDHALSSDSSQGPRKNDDVHAVCR